MFVETVAWKKNRLYLLDQTRLPQEEVYLELNTTVDLIASIRRLAVRGAPAIGVAGAFGVVLAAREALAEGESDAEARFRAGAAELERARPTAVNLGWAVARTLTAALGSGRPGRWEEAARLEAERLREEDLELSRAMAEHGLTILPEPATVLTHCNTGGLATAGGGTALGVVLEAARRGRTVRVHVDETRPLLQGARLNTWELDRAGVPYVVQCDGAAAWALSRGLIDVVLVGADRVAANGDTANKIGTLGVALAAQHSHVPFYVVAPRSSFDMDLPSGEGIPIEERAPEEVREMSGRPITTVGAPIWNPAFDVTPASLITGWITERGVERPPFST